MLQEVEVDHMETNLVGGELVSSTLEEGSIC